MKNKFMPKTPKEGYIGFYPVTNAQEWEELPDVYKAMEWFPIEVNRNDFQGNWIKEKTYVQSVTFDVVHLKPYKIRAKVTVHREDVQKILFCLHRNTECHLYSIESVEFTNGEKRGAKWIQDNRTGAFAISCGGHYVGKQGGFQWYIPKNIEETEDGFKWKGYEGVTHYEMSNPFK